MSEHRREPDFEKMLHVCGLSSWAVVNELVAEVGAGVTALIVGVEKAGELQKPSPVFPTARESNIRTALQVARIITAYSGRATAQRWFLGQNPELDFRTPLFVLRLNTAKARAMVLRAAIDFVLP